jgi:hypothetical protein
LRQLAKAGGHQMPKLAADPIAHDGPSNSPVHDESDPSRPIDRSRPSPRQCSKVDDETRPTGTMAGAHNGTEVRALPQSGCGRKHGGPDSGRRQAERP